MEPNNEEKWQFIKDGIDKYCKDDVKVIIHPTNKGIVQSDYKGCIFEYDNRMEYDGFIVGPKSFTM